MNNQCYLYSQITKTSEELIQTDHEIEDITNEINMIRKKMCSDFASNYQKLQQKYNENLLELNFVQQLHIEDLQLLKQKDIEIAELKMEIIHLKCRVVEINKQ